MQIETTRSHCIPTSMGTMKSDNPGGGEDTENWVSHGQLLEGEIGTATLRTPLTIPPQAGLTASLLNQQFLSWVSPNRNVDMCLLKLFLAVLFIINPNWQQLKYSSAEWLHTLWYINIIGC